MGSEENREIDCAVDPAGGHGGHGGHGAPRMTTYASQC